MDSKYAVDHGEFLYDTFPKDFLWGMGTASYQCEGGWDADGKGMNIWDTFVREKGKIEDGATGDIALDSYNHYKQDVQMLKEIGANVYRFSLSWARILPTGRTDKINQAGIDYYNSLINELLANGIEPLVTIYHWDLPQALQDIGGWLNPDIVQIFSEYARLCFERFGDRVKRWTTLNEPFISGYMAYHLCVFAPGGSPDQSAEAPYTYVHHQLMAHGSSYRIYQNEFKEKQGGLVGLSADTSCYLPFDPDSPEDIEAADRCYNFRLGWVLEPLYFGRYPKVMREFIDKRSKEEGREKSRLPEFDPVWSEKIKGSVDFIGINFYNAELCKARKDSEPRPNHGHWKFVLNIPFFSPGIAGWNQDVMVYRCHGPKWERCGASWQDFTPSGIRNCLNWVSKNYGNPVMMVTETGCSAVDDRLDDPQRTEFFKYSINAVLKAIKEDGCNVIGYVGWSLLDVMEWCSGYTFGFGIVQTDKSSPAMKRTLKNSAKFLATIFKSNAFIQSS